MPIHLSLLFPIEKNLNTSSKHWIWLRAIPLSLLLFIAWIQPAFGQVRIFGFVKEQGSGELLPHVLVQGPIGQTSSNLYGFFSISVKPGSNTLTFSGPGYQKIQMIFEIQKDTEVAIELIPDDELREVTIKGKKNQPVSENPQMSQINIPIRQIKDVPMLFGEKDVLKVIQLLPGVQKGSEGSSGIYVRGGGPDQNLIILDDAPVYNAYHLFGFFSLFNGDALKSVELTKGGFPARYGGRLSSVIEMQMKDGDRKKLRGEGGVGLISSRLTLEGPIKNDKTTFLVSGRRTYVDVLTQPFIKLATQGSVSTGYYFYDLNAKIHHDFSSKDKLYISGYLGRDKFYANVKEFDFSARNSLSWGNSTLSARFNHLYNARLFSNTSLIFSNFDFLIGASQTTFNAQTLRNDTFSIKYFSGIRDWTLKHDFDYLPTADHHIKTGGLIIFHKFRPGAINIRSSLDTAFNFSKTNDIPGIEGGIYIEDVWKVNDKIRINPGFRLSLFAANPKIYIRPEPRFSGSYMIKKDLSVKASYAMMNQYIHLLTNTGIGLPTDLWVPTTSRILPQQSSQVAAGIAKDYMPWDMAFTVEGYYKTMKNIVGYKEGASFIDIGDAFDQNSNYGRTWEDVVTQGKGWSYGLEFLAQKKTGKISGWVGYTLSWTQLQFADLNFGRKFYARYDRRHDISVVGFYTIKKNLKASFTWVYGTGNAITLPLQDMSVIGHIPGQSIPGSILTGTFPFMAFQTQYYGPKNSNRMAPYHRMDLGVQYSKKTKWGMGIWEFSIYNLYSRLNPFFYYLETNRNGIVVLKQLSLFPAIPSVSYNFRF